MESLEECGMSEMPAMPAPEQHEGNPVTVNVSMNASGKEHVADLLDMMKNAGLGGAAEVKPDMMPMRMDMERLKGIMDEPNEDVEVEEGGMKDQLIQAMEKIAADNSGQLLHKALRGAMGPDVQNYLQDMYDDVAVDNGLHPDDDHDDIEEKMWDQIEAEYGMGEGYANEPEAQYGDMSDAIPDGNDLNRKKKAYAKAQDGDNAMAVEEIKARLMAALAEKQKDQDEDGDNDFDDVKIARMIASGMSKPEAIAKVKGKK